MTEFHRVGCERPLVYLNALETAERYPNPAIALVTVEPQGADVVSQHHLMPLRNTNHTSRIGEQIKQEVVFAVFQRRNLPSVGGIFGVSVGADLVRPMLGDDRAADHGLDLVP